MSMSCQEFVELVTDYLDDALDADTRARFDEHLAQCPGCDVYLRQVETTARLAGTVTLDPLPRTAQAELLDAFRSFHRP